MFSDVAGRGRVSHNAIIGNTLTNNALEASLCIRTWDPRLGFRQKPIPSHCDPILSIP
jgi:hypothetical protein